MRRIRTYHDLEGDEGSEVLEQVVAQRRRLAERLAEVRCLVAVASGKGGVGKSAITANLAVALARRGRRVGALDADLNGPSLARMLGVSGARLGDSEAGAVPPESPSGVRVVSMELLQAEEDTPLSWRGPDSDRYLWQSSLETGVLREFLS
ncbi:MAG TPA: P-loop NTPase, partial [Longimicrobiales bacterium]|nr:P-loop NTPase [Longimicrobiales bacterium]